MMVLLLIGLGAGASLGALIGYWGKYSAGIARLTLTPHRGAVYGAILGVLVAAGPAKWLKSAPETSGVKRGEPPNNVSASKTTQTVHRDVLVRVNSAAEFERDVLRASKPCLADFYSDRCGPCRMLAPIIEDLARRYEERAVVCKVNLDLAPRLAARYNITGIPAVLFFEGGQEIHRLVGLRRQGDYRVILDMMIGKQ